jgi:hypothetical protein
MRVLLSLRRVRPFVALVAWAWASCAYGHELPDNRATIILREDRHVSVTIYLNWPEALRRTLSPARSLAEFVLVYSAMDSGHLKSALDRAELELGKAIQVTDNHGRKALVEKWAWPTDMETQAELRNLAAQLLIAPTQPPHDDPVEVRGDLVMTQRLDSVRVKFPREFDRVLVVSYRPSQVWVEKDRGPTEIHF